MKGYQLKITIKGSKPPIWRRVIVPEQTTFFQLHQVIQEAFGWWDYHLHQFEFKKAGILVRDVDEEDLDLFMEEEFLGEDTMLSALIEENPRFVYTYDFGDYWEHQILFEKEVEYDLPYPQVVKFKGDNLPEDCGGIYGYYDMMEILSQPDHAEYKEKKEWFESFCSLEFDMEEVNQNLQDLDAGEDCDFEETALLVEELEELYIGLDRESLNYAAKVHHIPGYSDMGKSQLISALMEKLLSKNYMSRFFGTVSDETIRELEKGALMEGREYDGDRGALEILNYGGYCAFTEKGVIIPADVIRLYRSFADEGFHEKRHICNTVWNCIKAAVYLYGAARPGQVEIICKGVGCDVDEEGILGLYQEMKGIWTDFAFWDHSFVDWNLMKGDGYEEVWRHQKGKEFCIPTPAQVDEIAREGAVDCKKHIRPLRAFFLSMIGCDEETAQAAAASIHNHIRLGTTPAGVEAVMEHYGLNLDSQEKMRGFDEIMEQVWRETKTVGNCGYSRAELEAREAYISPDAPCPCGSGKRYRQCCGRKQGR